MQDAMHPFKLMQLATQFLAEPDDAAAMRMLDQYPELPADLVRAAAPMARGGGDADEDARVTRRLQLLDRWPMLKFALASQRAGAAEARLRSERSVDALRAVVAASEEAAAASEAAPVEPAMKASLLAHTMQLHYSLWANTQDQPSLDRAIDRGLQAEQLVAGSSAELLPGLLVARYERSGERGDLERAVALVERLLPGDRIPPGDDALSVQASTLANALRHRYLVTSDPSDINRAVALYDRLAALPVDAARRAIRQVNLAAGLLTRYDGAGDLSDLDRGIEILQALVNAWPDGTDGRSTAANDLALALMKRFMITKRRDDVAQAIVAGGLCISLLAPSAPETLRNLTTGGTAALLGYRNLERPELLALAVKIADRVSEQAQGRTIEAARAFQFASDCLLERFMGAKSQDDVDRAVDLARRAAEAAVSSAPVRAAGVGQLALAFRRRSESTWARPSDVDDAISAYRAAVPAAIPDSALHALEMGIEWGEWALQRQARSEAAEALLLAMDAHQRVLDSQRDRQSRELRSKRVQGLGALAAVSLARAGERERAAVTMERGRGLLMAQALNLRPEDVTLAGIRKQAGGTPLVYLENVDGGYAVIVTERGVSTLDLPALTEPAINQWLAANIDLRLSKPEKWEQQLQDLCRWLWGVVMGPLVEHLKPHTQATLVPGGYLAMLPLHAAWTEDPRAPGGRRYVLDELTIRYAPRAGALRPGKRPLRASLLCVDEPAPVKAPKLPYSEAEVKAAARHFTSRTVLPGRKATRAAVVEELGRRSVLHLSCHGTARLDQPLDSGLLLSGNEMLTLRDFLGMRLEKVDLAVLSACDTGQMGTALPDEAVGLPGGMLQAGARGVISALWPIDSFATLLLVARFYECLRDDGLAPAAALGRAQCWLRDTTNQEKGAHFKDVPEIRRPLLMRDPDARDHAALSDWAAFSYAGA